MDEYVSTELINVYLFIIQNFWLIVSLVFLLKLEEIVYPVELNTPNEGWITLIQESIPKHYIS